MKDQEIFIAIEQSFGSIQQFHTFELDNRFEVEITNFTIHCEPCVRLIFWFEEDKYIAHIISKNNIRWLNNNSTDWLRNLCFDIVRKRDHADCQKEVLT